MRILNTPVKVGELTLKNRLVMPPMATARAENNGAVNDALCAYYDEKSRGGHIGLIIAEHAYVSTEGKASERQLSIANDSDIEGLRRLTGMIHRNGSAVFAQLNHAGATARFALTGLPSFAPSRYPQEKAYNGFTQEMTAADLQKAAADFAAAAGRAKAAGFDGVEIHAAHGYLLNQFYSPLTNKRENAYSGALLEGRLYFLLQVIAAVRAAVGTAYPLALRLGAGDYMPGGTTVEDSVQAAPILEAAGIDLLDISGGMCRYTNPNTSEEGYFRELSAAVREKIHIPVILTGGIRQASTAEELLRGGCADMIGVGRVIAKDSAWAAAAMM